MNTQQFCWVFLYLYYIRTTGYNIMAKIKLSTIKEIFNKVGVSEGLFDMFKSKRRKLTDKLDSVKNDIDDIIKSAPTEKDKEDLQRLANAFRAVSAQKRKMGR